MKKRREIILDFTSLLDVILIILFFFILFSHIETMDAKEAAQKAQEAAQAVAEEAETARLEAEAAREDAYDLLDRASDIEKGAAANIAGIDEFVRGQNLRFSLRMAKRSWTLEIYAQDVLLAEIEQDETDRMTDALSELLTAKGYAKDDALLCIFMYDGAQGGTAAAYREIQALFREMRQTYPYFYVTELDSSVYESGE